MKEETGLNAVKYKYMCSRYHEPRDVLMLGYIVVVSDGEIKLNEDEITEARWCTFDEALQAVDPDSTAGFFLKTAVSELKKIQDLKKKHIAARQCVFFNYFLQ